MTKGWSLADRPVAAAAAKGGGFVVTLPAGSTGVWVQVKGTTIADPGPSGGTTIIKASPPAPDGCGGLWHAGAGSRPLSQLTYAFAVDDPAAGAYDVVVGYDAGYGKLQISAHTFVVDAAGGAAAAAAVLDAAPPAPPPMPEAPATTLPRPVGAVAVAAAAAAAWVTWRRCSSRRASCRLEPSSTTSSRR